MAVEWATIQDLIDRVVALEEALAKLLPSAPASSPLPAPSASAVNVVSEEIVPSAPSSPRPDSAMTAPDALRGYN